MLWAFVIALAVAGLSLSVIPAARSITQAQTLADAEAAQEARLESIIAVTTVESAILKAERGAWAFAATSDAAHLEALAEAGSSARASSRRLVDLAGDQARRHVAVQLSRCVDRALGLFDRAIETAQRGDRGSAMAQLRQQLGGRAVDDVRDLRARIELDARQADAHHRQVVERIADEATGVEAWRILLRLLLLALFVTGVWLLVRERDLHREARLRLSASIKLNLLEKKSRRAEQALVEREAQLSLAIEHAPAGVAIFDREMRFIAASRRFAADYGLPGNIEFEGQSFYDIVRETPQRWLDFHRRVIDIGEEISADEDIFYRRDGRTDWLRWSMRPWRAASGQIGGLVLFSEVITSQLEGQRRVAESAARFRAVFENAAVGVARVSFGDERILEMNQALCDMLGFAPSEAVGLQWSDITYPDDLGTDFVMLHQLTDGTLEGYSVEKRLLHRNGGEIWARLTKSAVRLTDGSPDFQIWIVEDVGLRRDAERSLRDERDRTRAYLDVVAVAVIAADCDGTIQVINRRGCEILGYSDPSELVGRNWYDMLLSDEVGQHVRTVIDSFICANIDVPLPYEIAVRRSDGTERIVAWRNMPLRDDHGRVIGILASGEDVTDVRRTEAKLREVQSELIHSSRLSAMGTMAATMAHELTQPLTAISNFLSTGAELVHIPGVAAAEALREALAEAAAQSVRAGDILHHLRDFVSKGETDRMPARLSTIVDDATSLALIGEGRTRVRLSVDIDEEADKVIVDSVQVEQVLVNIMRNAVESMASAPVRELRVTSRVRDRDFVQVNVEDTGPGLANGGEGLFKPFMTTKASGLGLGLSISKTIIESHGGALWAENRAGGGAKFTFTLPRAGEAAYG